MALRFAAVFLTVALLLAPCARAADAQPGNATESQITIPFSVHVRNLRQDAVNLGVMAPQGAPTWTEIKCDVQNPFDLATVLGCLLYFSIGQLLGGVNEYRYTAIPTSFNLRGTGTTFGITLSYRGAYEVELNGPFAHPTCGDPAHDDNPATGKKDYLHWDGELTGTIDIDKSWKYTLNTARTIRSDAACKMHIAAFVEKDFTPFIQRFAENYIDRETDKAKPKVAQAGDLVRDAVSSVWIAAQQPIPVQTLGWLHLNPTRIALIGPLVNGSDDDLVLSGAVQLGYAPFITATPDASPPSPLPDLSDPWRLALSSNPTIQTDVVVPYTALENSLGASFDGRHLPTKDFPWLPNYRIGQLRVTPLLSGSTRRLQVSVPLSWISGATTVNLEGAPAFDATTQTLSFPDLNLSAESRDYLNNNVATLVHHDEWMGDIRRQAKQDLQQAASSAAWHVQGALSSSIKGIRFNQALTAVDIVGVAVGADGFVVTLRFTGDGRSTGRLDVPS